MMTVQWFMTEDTTARIVGYEWCPLEEGSAFGSLSLLVRDEPSDVWGPPKNIAERVLLRTARDLVLDQRGRVMGAWVHDDGGRAGAGFRGDTGDCVTRAIAIATGHPYADVYRALHTSAQERGVTGRKASPRNGVARKDYDRYLRDLGWQWTPTMSIGSGCTVHLRPDELPAGRIIVRLSRHLAAVVDGVLHDTFDCSRDGTRCVYGYWKERT